MAINTEETQINASNVAKLTQLFQVAIPDAPDGAAVALSGVTTPMGVKDLVFIQGQHGQVSAFDGTNGALIWRNNYTSPFGTSAPALDPNRQFIYVNIADGMIHKLQVGDGSEIKTGGWPISNGGGQPNGQLAIGTDKTGTSYLYATNNGHGHITTVNLSTGSTHVFNLACSNFPDTNSPSKCDVGAAPWARTPVFLPDLQKVYIGTGTNSGSGQFVAGQIWRTSWVALPPDGHTTMMAGGGYPADSYTVTDWSNIVKGDADTAVGGFIPLPTDYSSKYSHLVVQPGKDGKIRILNAEDLSGMGGPGHLGGELVQVNANMGLLRAWGTIWVNPADKVAWVFIGAGNGLAGYTVDLDAAGMPGVTMRWANKNGWTTAPFMANGVLYATNNAGEHTNDSATLPHLIQALDPATGHTLWTDTVRPHHWSSPIMVNSILYLADGDSGGCDRATSGNCKPDGTNGKITAWSIK